MIPLAANELVDVIDDDGNTIAVVTRREMRERRLPHRCTYVLVFNAKGELFIHQRTPIKDVYPSYWDLCVGGVVTAGESFDASVVREVREEIGVEAPLERLFPFRYQGKHTFAHGMVYRAVHEGPFQLQPEEIVRGEFVALEEALRRIERDPFCPDGVLVLRRYLDSQAPG
jgi:isopentenyldiphosphate isomerase